jgi:hypothetical protein
LATFPASEYLAMALEAKRQISLGRQIQGPILRYVLRNVVFSQALIIPEPPGKVELYLSLKGSRSAVRGTALVWEEFCISSVSGDGIWHEHCHGSIMAELPMAMDDQRAREREELLATMDQVHAFSSGQPQRLDRERLYQDMQAKGNYYGQNFALIQELYLSQYQANGTVVIPDVAQTMPSNFMQAHIIHPTTLDALIHSCLPIFSQHSDTGSVYTVGVGEISISSCLLNLPHEKLWFATTLTPQGSSSAAIDIVVTQTGQGDRDQIVIKITGGELYGVTKPQDTSATSHHRRHMNYQLKWGEDPDFSSSSGLKVGVRAMEDERELLSSERKLRLLNRVASFFIKACLDQVTEEQVQDQHKEFFRWMSKFHSSEQSRSLDLTSESNLTTCLITAAL